MKKEIIEVPVLSPMMRALGVPCSSVTRANGFVFVAATPPVDMVTGKIVRGDIETQTEASLNAVKLCLEAAGTSFENVVVVRIYAPMPASTTPSTASTPGTSPTTFPRAVLSRCLAGSWNSTSRSR